MKTRFICLGLIFLVFCSTGCQSIAPIPTVTKTALSQSPTESPTQTVPPTKTIQPTPTIRITPTITPRPSIGWTEAFPMFVVEGFLGIWSPTENVILYETDQAESYSRKLSTAAAPDFQPLPLPIASDLSIFEDSFTWSPDGRQILFISSALKPFTFQIYALNADGTNPHPLNPDFLSDRDIVFNGWLDQDNLIITQYGGGGHWGVDSIHRQTGQVASWGAFIKGAVFPANRGYIPVTNSIAIDLHQIMVVSEKLPNQQIDQSRGGNIALPPPYKTIAPEETTSLFEDWLPDSNQMLVSWKQYDVANWETEDQALLLWNVEANSIQLIAPDGISGRFSPDGKLLIYLTSGPAALNSDRKPVEAEPKADELAVDYLQLMDMGTGEVFLSVPVLTRVDYDTLMNPFGIVSLEASFSPNSRYLAFLSPGKLQVDTNGWPTRIDPASSENITLHLLDLQERKLAWSAPSNAEAAFSWSPTSGVLVFQDDHSDWNLLDANAMQALPITTQFGEHLGDPGWSYDGRYFHLAGCIPLKDEKCNPSTYIFDVTLTQ